MRQAEPDQALCGTLIPKQDRDLDRAICDAATTDWRAGAVQKFNLFCRATHSDRLGDERVVMRANEYFPHEADVRAAANCRNRLPEYLDAMDEIDRRVGEVKRLHADVVATQAKMRRQGEHAAAQMYGDKAATLERVLAILCPVNHYVYRTGRGLLRTARAEDAHAAWSKAVKQHRPEFLWNLNGNGWRRTRDGAVRDRDMDVPAEHARRLFFDAVASEMPAAAESLSKLAAGTWIAPAAQQRCIDYGLAQDFRLTDLGRAFLAHRKDAA